jgi:hypothetical protein
MSVNLNHHPTCDRKWPTLCEACHAEDLTAFNLAHKEASTLNLDVESAHAEAMKIMVDAKKLLVKTGLEVSLINRCPNGAKWPVLMLEVGQKYADIDAVRNGKR